MPDERHLIRAVKGTRDLLPPSTALWNRVEAETRRVSGGDKRRFPVLPAYDQVLKCSHLFNLLDSRGAISVTERVGVIGRVRRLALGVAACLGGSTLGGGPISFPAGAAGPGHTRTKK